MKTHAHHQGFINITESAEFSEATVFNEDTLDDLGYNGVGVLYQYALSISSNASKKETGAFYTPEDIADIMAARASSGIHEQGRWTSPLLRWNSSELLEHIDTTPQRCYHDINRSMLPETKITLELGQVDLQEST